MRSETWEAAEKGFKRLVRIAPDQGPVVEAHRCAVLASLVRNEEALQSSRRALAWDPAVATVWSNRCGALSNLQRLDEAAHSGRLAIQANPQLADGLYNLGVVERFRGNMERARDLLREACALAPENATYRYANTLIELSDGDLDTGIANHASRWRQPKFSAVRRMWPEPELPVPVWDGRPLDGTLAIWGEQGVGDEIWFAGYLPRAIARARHVVLEITPHLVDLFARSFPEITVLPRFERETQARLEAADAQRPIGDLLELFALEERDAPGLGSRPGYLKPDADRVAALRARYAPDGAPLVGISWRSVKPIRKRSFLAPLPDWRPLLLSDALKARGARFVSLQYGKVDRELADIRRRFGVEIVDDPEIDPLSDMDAAAAQIAAMDGVISVANACVGLTHGLGRRCVVVTRLSQDDWRYSRLLPQSRWLPLVRHFWQTREGDWRGAIADAEAQLVADLDAARAG